MKEIKDESPADETGGNLMEGGEDVGDSLVADDNQAKAGQCAFHSPATLA